ncbi:MAG: TetR family transcriptional regulator C-terminal domain-containing protein [Bradyrhizobium canariense]|jgi:AcrR family transcriptional regulator
MPAPRSPKVKHARGPLTASVASSDQRPVDETTDKRLLRGLRSRKLVLARAVDIASLESLEGLSFGRLATETGMSKAGIQALFETKQTLQKDTFAYALEMFRDFVVRPAEAKPQGVHRFRELIDRWLQYAERPLFAGGCFFAANLTQLDSHPGPLRDLVAGAQRAWVARLSAELKHAVKQKDIVNPDPELSAFQIEAVLRSANTAFRLGEPIVTRKVWRVVDSFLTAADK